MLDGDSEGLHFTLVSKTRVLALVEPGSETFSIDDITLIQPGSLVQFLV